MLLINPVNQSDCSFDEQWLFKVSKISQDSRATSFIEIFFTSFQVTNFRLANSLIYCVFYRHKENGMN